MANNTQRLGSIWKGRAWDDGEVVPRVTLPDSTLAEAMVALNYGWNGSAFVKLIADANGALTVAQGTGQGKTLLFGAITQGAAGSTTLVAADATRKVKVVSYVVVLDAAGTFKFNDGTADLSGAIPVAQYGGAVASAEPTSHLMETGAINRPLNIISGTGKAFGHFSYFLEA